MASETALAVTRSDHPSDRPEHEIAVVEQDGDRARIVLDDGVVLDFNAVELAAAATPPRSGHARAAA